MIVAAHPTTYAGARFRSRLEARWAAFFDLAGWVWEYEPTDAEGWVPDFVLLGTAGNLRVEVKPIEWEGLDTHGYVAQAVVRDDLLKVRVQSTQALVLGLYPVPVDYDAPFLGVMLNTPEGHTPLLLTKDTTLVRCGASDEDWSWGRVGYLWRQAGAKVQWRAK